MKDHELENDGVRDDTGRDPSEAAATDSFCLDPSKAEASDSFCVDPSKVTTGTIGDSNDIIARQHLTQLLSDPSVRFCHFCVITDARMVDGQFREPTTFALTVLYEKVRP